VEGCEAQTFETDDFFDGGMYREYIWEAIGLFGCCVVAIERLLLIEGSAQRKFTVTEKFSPLLFPIASPSRNLLHNLVGHSTTNMALRC
jgi:hypothetical protein